MFHAYCFIHPQKEVQLSAVEAFIKNKQIHEIDILRFTDSTLTIAQVRNLIHFISRAPFASSLKVAIIVAEISLEAQHALLKTLEEPPPHTLLILATAEHKLLPTLMSRCHLIILPVATASPHQDHVKPELFWKKLLPQKVGERLAASALIYRDPETLTSWLTEQTQALYELLPTTYETGFFLTPAKLAFILKQLVTTHSLLAGNISIKLSLDHLFLSLPYQRS
jgi:hypothetical protein